MTRPKPRPLPRDRLNAGLQAFALGLLQKHGVGGPKQRKLVADVLAYVGDTDLSNKKTWRPKAVWAIRYAFSWIRSQLVDLAKALRIPFEGVHGNFRYGKEWRVTSAGGLNGVGIAVAEKVRKMYLARLKPLVKGGTRGARPSSRRKIKKGQSRGGAAVRVTLVKKICARP